MAEKTHEPVQIDAARAKTDKLYFCKSFMNFVPRDNQKDMLLHPATRKLIRAGRRWGKDTIIMIGDAMHHLYTIPKAKIGMYGPGWEEIDAVMEIVHEWIDDTPLFKSVCKPYNKRDLKLTNGSRLIGRVAALTSRGKRGRGFTMLIWIEAAFIPEKVIASIRATRLIGSAPEWMSSTPCGHNHFYKSEQSGVYQCWHRSSYDNPLIDPKELEREKLLMSDLEFRQEIMAEYVSDATAPFPLKLVEEAYGDKQMKLIIKPEFGKDGVIRGYYAGLDLGRRRDKAVLYIIEPQGDDIFLRYVWEFNYDPKDPRFWDKVLSHTQYVCTQFRVIDLWVDQTGIGDKPCADLKNYFADTKIPVRVTGIDFSYAVKNKWEGLINSLCLRFERYQIHMPFIKELVTQLGSIRFESTSRRFMTYGKSPDHVVALSLACSAVPRARTSFFYSRANREVHDANKTEQAVSYP